MGLLDCSYATEVPSASAILQELRAFREGCSVLYIAAHPDDENTQLIAYLSRGRGIRTGYLSLTRGEGGQNLIGPEIGDPLGVIRTQELLAARRIDGGQQFFTRAKDFGFSKSYEQTLAKWDRQAVLADVVRVIREFQPDVVITRFPPEAGGTHGHHTASTVLALEAFKLAGDAKAFPEHLQKGGLAPWQPRRILWNSFRGTGDRPTLRLDIGGYLPLLGESIGEISALSRSSHRSQGYGSVASRGSRMDEFQSLDGQSAGQDLFDGIDTTWSRWTSFAEVGLLIDDVISHFNPQDPSISVPAILAIRSKLLGSDLPRQIEEKRRQIDRILQDCLGLYVETTIPQSEAVPGETLKLQHVAIVRSGVPVRWLSTSSGPLDSTDHAVDLHANQPTVRETSQTLPLETPLSQPYWLRTEGTPGMYRVEDPALIGQPGNPPALLIEYRFEVGGQTFTVPVTPVQVTADPAKGETRHQLDVIPPVALTTGRDVLLLAPKATGSVTVEIKSSRNDQNGTLVLNAPDRLEGLT